MAWWGKVIGSAFGFWFGGPLGAVLGAALGHSFDQGMVQQDQEEPQLETGNQERVQIAFFTATFSVLGAVAKADGRVSPDEIALAENIMAEMDLTQEKRRLAIQLFNEGKAPDFPLAEALEQFRTECHRRSNLMRLFLEIQIQAAFADGELHPAETKLLLEICRHLGFPEFIFRQLLRRIQAEQGFHHQRQGSHASQRGPSLADAYQIIGVEESAANAEIKKSYRRLMSQHHPDKLIAKGLPEEMMKLAEQKTIEIKQAYEQIKAARGMR